MIDGELLNASRVMKSAFCGRVSGGGGGMWGTGGWGWVGGGGDGALPFGLWLDRNIYKVPHTLIFRACLLRTFFFSFFSLFFFFAIRLRRPVTRKTA